MCGTLQQAPWSFAGLSRNLLQNSPANVLLCTIPSGRTPLRIFRGHKRLQCYRPQQYKSLCKDLMINSQVPKCNQSIAKATVQGFYFPGLIAAQATWSYVPKLGKASPTGWIAFKEKPTGNHHLLGVPPFEHPSWFYQHSKDLLRRFWTRNFQVLTVAVGF